MILLVVLELFLGAAFGNDPTNNAIPVAGLANILLHENCYSSHPVASQLVVPEVSLSCRMLNRPKVQNESI